MLSKASIFPQPRSTISISTQQPFPLKVDRGFGKEKGEGQGVLTQIISWLLKINHLNPTKHNPLKNRGHPFRPTPPRAAHSHAYTAHWWGLGREEKRCARSTVRARVNKFANESKTRSFPDRFGLHRQASVREGSTVGQLRWWVRGVCSVWCCVQGVQPSARLSDHARVTVGEAWIKAKEAACVLLQGRRNRWYKVWENNK